MKAKRFLRYFIVFVFSFVVPLALFIVTANAAVSGKCPELLDEAERVKDEIKSLKEQMNKKFDKMDANQRIIDANQAKLKDAILEAVATGTDDVKFKGKMFSVAFKGCVVGKNAYSCAAMVGLGTAIAIETNLKEIVPLASVETEGQPLNCELNDVRR